MARIRTIKPDFWTDESVVECSPLARLLFIGLWNFADDDGRMVYSPVRVKLQILPADNCDISKLIDELASRRMVLIYQVESVSYLAIPNFPKHQKIDKRTASKLPEPPRVSPNPPESPRIPPTEWKGMEGNGKELTTTAADEKPRRQPKQARIAFDLEAGSFRGITEEDELRWQDAYPAVPIPPEISRAAAWLKANPANRKSNCERFLVNWFSRAQDKAARVR